MISDYSELRGPLYRRDGTVLTEPDEIMGALEASVIETVGELHSAGKSVVMVGPPPHNETDLGRCYRYQYMYGGAFEICDFQERHISDLDQDAQDLLAEQSGIVPVVDLVSLICTDGVCKTTLDGVNLYRDAEHLSIKGSRLFGERHDLAGLLLSTAENGGRPSKGASLPPTPRIETIDVYV